MVTDALNRDLSHVFVAEKTGQLLALAVPFYVGSPLHDGQYICFLSLSSFSSSWSPLSSLSVSNQLLLVSIYVWWENLEYLMRKYEISDEKYEVSNEKIWSVWWENKYLMRKYGIWWNPNGALSNIAVLLWPFSFPQYPNNRDSFACPHFLWTFVRNQAGMSFLISCLLYWHCWYCLLDWKV